MNKKRLVAMCAAVAVVATLAVGCGQKSNTSQNNNTSTPTKKTDVKIGMSTDQGGLGDKSFNDSAYLGLQNIQKDYGVKPNVLQSKQQENYEPNLTQLAQSNDLTFAIGFMMSDALKKVATANPDKKFGLIDEVVDLPNVMSITFKEEEGSFLMGVIAGKMTKSNKIGFIGGVDGPLIQKFESGFAAGVASVNPEAAKGLMRPDPKTFGTTVRYAGNFNDSAKGYELAKSLYNDGCDVIYHASGAVGLGLFKAAKEMHKWAIGVDQDQAAGIVDKSGKPMYDDVILSSMIKKVDIGTYTASKDLIEGKFKAGHLILGLKDNGVGIAPTSDKNTPKDVIELVKKYQDSIVSGKITVPATPADAKAYKPVAVQ